MFWPLLFWPLLLPLLPVEEEDVNGNAHGGHAHLHLKRQSKQHHGEGVTARVGGQSIS